MVWGKRIGQKTRIQVLTAGSTTASDFHLTYCKSDIVQKFKHEIWSKDWAPRVRPSSHVPPAKHACVSTPHTNV